MWLDVLCPKGAIPGQPWKQAFENSEITSAVTSNWSATVDEVTVTDHGRAVARLVPLGRPRPLDRLIAEGLVTPGRTSKRPRTGPAIKAQGTVSDLVAEQRR